jgi:phosphoribosylformylglycinamidine cyclo-ligase
MFGTKPKVAQMAEYHDTVGADSSTTASTTSWSRARGPCSFDYLATGRLEPGVAVQVVAGMARACSANGCALLGGETAEMPGFYAPGEYDLAGFIVGAVRRDLMLRREAVLPGDALIALPSDGLHTNGYSLARKVFFDVLDLAVDADVTELGRQSPLSAARAPLLPMP